MQGVFGIEPLWRPGSQAAWGRRGGRHEGACACGTGRMRASHILVKWQGSRRPASWRDPEGREILGRDKDRALAMLGKLNEALASGTPFAEVAQVSDCGSAKQGGDLGEFGPGQMQKPFEDAVLALAVGQLSGPVWTDSGVHLILRTG